MAKLNQLLAIEKGVKQTAYTDLTASHHRLQQTDPLTGIARTYQPLDDDGETQPPENKHVQLKTEESLGEVAQILTRLFDVTATKDWANCNAKSDVKIGDKVLLTGVPATYLLFLEKQLADLHTLVKKLPVLDPGERWTFDNTTGVHKSESLRTNRSKKVLRNHLRAEATKEHPAQVDSYTEDVKVGEWTTTKFSGALPATQRDAYLERVIELQNAVKFAREAANMTDVVDQHIGKKVFDYLFGTAAA
jgi:hypothetical protein